MRARSISAWFRCSSSRRRWRCSSTCRRRLKRWAEPLEQAPGGIDPPFGQLAGERPLLAAGQAVEARRVLGEQVPGDARLPLAPAARGGGHQLAEVAVAGLVGGQESEPRLGVHRAVRAVIGRLGIGHQAERAEARPFLPEARLVLQHHLGAHQRLDPRLLRRLEEARRGVDAVGVHQRHGRQAQRRRPLDQILGERGAVEEREGGGRVQLGVGRGSGRAPHLPRLGISGA